MSRISTMAPTLLFEMAKCSCQSSVIFSRSWRREYVIRVSQRYSHTWPSSVSVGGG
jgi:hypothetical protein